MLLFFSTLTLLVVLAVSCSKNESATKSEGKEGDLPFEISIMLNYHTPEIPNGRIKSLIEDATNTSLNIHFIPDDNYIDRLNTAFATGTLPMVVPMNFQMFNQFKDAIRDEQFWEIGPYLQEYENLRKLKPEILANTKVDGKIYSLYQGRPLSRQGIIYRKDWADYLGLSAPTTTDEFFELARAFTEDDPNRTGKNDTIGLTERSDLVYGAFKTIASWFGVPNDFGKQDGKIQPEFMFPQYMDTLVFMRNLYENGYVNQNFPVTSKNDQQALFKNGVAGIYVGSMADVNNLYKETVVKHPEVVFDVHNNVKGPHGEFGVWAIPGYSNVVLFPKSSVKTEADLKQILSFYDNLMKPEISNLLLWGIEGEHYEVVNGMAKIIDSSLHDDEVRPYLAMEIGESETRGSYERYFSYDVQVKAIDLISNNERYLIHNPAIALDSDTFVLDGGSLYQIIEDATIKYILGQIDEEGFQVAVELWLENGGNQIIEEYTESYNKQN
ncbi:extracellular solute-binding protein [Anaerobacillus alkaliphilus]|uniref:Extracellular solute-binding protein n=1 Tax=Anaerobacillus alkaliphilus TaxID=1548597 RepID=A0A4Q0VV88_9BACI|nr:extracellular solute-binding protein [Anaerobacillus alkaliphilus]